METKIWVVGKCSQNHKNAISKRLQTAHTSNESDSNLTRGHLFTTFMNFDFEHFHEAGLFMQNKPKKKKSH